MSPVAPAHVSTLHYMASDLDTIDVLDCAQLSRDWFWQNVDIVTQLSSRSIGERIEPTLGPSSTASVSHNFYRAISNLVGMSS